MSDSGLEVFDRTLQTTHIWLNEIGETVGSDTHRQYHALRAVISAVRDRLPVDEAFHLSAQLPMLVRGIFWESYRPAGKPERLRSRQEFLERVSDGLGQMPPMVPEDCTRAVFGVLSTHLPEGELNHVKQLLPGPVREMFSEVASQR
jgi:uncharacterized protein (DUF2267 family)